MDIELDLKARTAERMAENMMLNFAVAGFMDVRKSTVSERTRERKTPLSLLGKFSEYTGNVGVTTVYFHYNTFISSESFHYTSICSVQIKVKDKFDDKKTMRK